MLGQNGLHVKKLLLAVCIHAATLQILSAAQWEPATHECSLTFPDGGWTFQKGAALPQGQIILAAFNREQTKSVTLVTVQVPPSMSVQAPGFATSFKRGFASSGSRPLKDGYTNLNGHVAYWLTGEKNITGRQASTLSYSLREGGTLYQLHVESLGTQPIEDNELLAISASFNIHGNAPIPPRSASPADSFAFRIGLIIGVVAVLILWSRQMIPKLRKR